MTVRYYSSTSQPTTLVLNVTPSSTTIEVAALVGYPGSFPYTLCLDYDTGLRELVEVTNASGTTLTVTRAIDGTSAIAHSAGASVRHVSSARDYADSRNHENSDASVHGVTGMVVGTTDMQTLTNKTLTSPTISNPTITGTIPSLNLSSPVISGTVTGGATYSGISVGGGSTLDSVTMTGVSTMTGSFNTLKSTPSSAPGAQIHAPLGFAQRAMEYTVDGTDITYLDADGSLTTGKPTSYHTLFGNAEVTGNLLVDGTLNTGAVASTGAVSGTAFTGTSFAGGTVSGTTGTFTGTVTATNANISGGVTATTGTYSGALSASNFSSAWTSWSPNWTASTTNPVIGSGGSITGVYSRFGKMVTAFIQISLGTGFSMGSGAYRWTLPTTALNGRIGGSLSYFKVGGSDLSGIPMALGLPGNATQFQAIAPGGSSNWGSGTVGTPLAGDTFTIMVTYQEV